MIQTPESRLKLLTALKEISACMTRVEAERELLKNIKNDICTELELERKVLNKLARTYHKGDFHEENVIHKNFADLYDFIVANTKG